MSNASATIMMDIEFTIGVVFFIIITILAITTRANHHIRSLIIFIIGGIVLFTISFAGTQSIEKKDLHQITCKHYDTYAYDANDKIYTISKVFVKLKQIMNIKKSIVYSRQLLNNLQQKINKRNCKKNSKTSASL